MKDILTIRKNIDLPTDVVKGLERLADADKRKTKPYLEKVLIDHYESCKIKKIKNDGK